MSSSLNSQDYQRLLKIEKLVLTNVDIASRVTGELAKLQGYDAGHVKQLCQEYMNNMKAAHELVHEGVATFQGQRAYELHAYHALCKAHVTSEKLDVLGLHLGALQKALGDATPGGTNGAARTRSAAAAAAEAAAAGE